eukprot:SAG11_NODE_2408_length_3396_cov_2.260843_3_plen_84_part_00
MCPATARAVHLVCPHHKLLDLMGAWSAPNKSTLQGMAPVHASKAQRKGLRMDHLFNDRADAKARLEAVNLRLVRVLAIAGMAT